MSDMVNKLLLIIAIFIAVGGCAEIRKVTYPPEFSYIGKGELKGSMRRMAAAMGQLDALIAADSVANSSRENIIEQLDIIDGVASNLSGGQRTNHLLLDKHMDQFSADLAKAKLMASISPPNYYYAGRLSGSCSGCHRFR